MDEDPNVSVLTPAYNAEAFLPEAIASVQAQTYSNFEHIIIDDGSADNTWDVIQSAAREDQRIRPFRNEKNLKISATRNRCIQQARGNYVVWQDADDISLPPRLERLTAHMEHHPEVGICGSFIQLFDEQQNTEVRQYPAHDKALRAMLFRCSPVSLPAAIVRRACYDKVGLYDVRYKTCEDLDMTFRIGAHYQLANVQEVLLMYRHHRQSTTWLNVRGMIKDTLAVRRQHNDGTCYRMKFSDRLVWLATVGALALPPAMVLKLFNMQRSRLLTKLSGEGLV